MDTLLASDQTRRGPLSFKGKEAVCGGLLLLTVVERWEDGGSFGFLVLGSWETRGKGGRGRRRGRNAPVTGAVRSWFLAKESNLSASLFLPERVSGSWFLGDAEQGDWEMGSAV